MVFEFIKVINMGFSKWWKELSYWKKGIYIGLVVGFLKMPFLLFFGEYIPDRIGSLITKIPDEMLCNFFDLGIGEKCGWFFLFFGFLYNPIFFGIIGGVLGLTHKKSKGK